MNSRKKEIDAFYDRLYTLLYKKHVGRKIVKRLLYDDKETHEKLGIVESSLNIMWARLLRKSQNNPITEGTLTIKGTQYKVVKLEKSKKPKQANKGGDKMAKVIIQYDPTTNHEVKRFKSAIICAEETGFNVSYIRRVAEGDVKNPLIHLRYEDSPEQKAEISEQKPKRKYTKKVEPIVRVEQGKAGLIEAIKEVTKQPSENPESVVELIDGYEELNETPLEKKNETNPFETAPNPEPVPQKMAESHSWVKTPIGLRFEPVEQKIVINADIEIQHTTGDKTTLEVIRAAYIQELKNHINDEVKKMTSEIIAEETKLFIEGTKTI